MNKENTPKLFVSVSPHIHSGVTTEKVMYSVIASLMPALLVGIYFFGLNALIITLVSITTAIISEALCQKLMGKKITISDGSAIVTGLLLALTLPSSCPLWMVVVGSAFAIIIGKQIYGGLGHNLFNPALTARIVLLISWPVQMTTWPVPKGLFSRIVDATTSATPLGILKTEGISKMMKISLMNPFIGKVGGSFGEISVIALLLGAIYLLKKGYITWHIPISYILTVFIITGVCWVVNPAKYANPIFHIVTGGLILGAFFMATDMVTTPITPQGMLIFGIGCGIITTVIRLWGGYPEGVSFAILFMNALTPMIDRYVKPRPLGYRNQ